MRRIALPATLCLALVVALPAPASAAATKPKRAAALPAFRSCDDLVGYARRGAERPVVPVRALTGFGGPRVTPRRPSSEPRLAGPMPMPVSAPATAEARGDAGSAYSTTNVQEAGIDEPDLVKTDGERAFVVAGTTLWALDVRATVPVAVGKLALAAGGTELLLRGDRLLVIEQLADGARAQATAPSVAPPPRVAPSVVGPSELETRLTEVDVRDPAAMKIARTMTVPGNYVTARMTGGTARIVLNSPAALPDTDRQPVAEGERTPAPRLGLRAFVPRTVLRSRVTGKTVRRTLVPCRNVRHPRQFAGLDLLTVLTVDFDRGLFNVDRDAVMASAQVVYASAGSLYVASTKAAEIDDAGDIPDGMRTELHRFDAGTPGETSYAASGSVTGFVLNQYALSEHDGALRVASTEEPLWLAGAGARESSSAVTVLRQRAGRLEAVGRVGGLGRGERIYAARFIGDAGYLVTFRQTDPLYTLDLREPTAPKVAGELKITGYSAYLHPVGDGLLLGIGQEATPEGRRTGAQASLFDVSNPAQPVRLAQRLLGNGTAASDFDPHAFLWWSKRELAVVPVSGWNERYEAQHAAVGLKTGRAGGLAETGRITHGPAWDQGQIVRSLIVDDRVLTISAFGVAAHRIDGFAPIGFLPFA